MAGKVKMIHVVSDMNIGGAGQWLLNFLKEVDREKFDVSVVIPQGSLLKDGIQKLKVRIIEVPGIANRSFDIKAIRFLYHMFKSERPDIVHTHACLSARIAAKAAGINPIVYTKHCIDQPDKLGIKTIIGKIANISLCNHIISVANAAKESLVASGIPEDMITVVHNGVEKLTELSIDEKQQIRQKWGIRQEELVVGIIARLEAVKGHEYFLEAASLVAKQRENIKFLVVGTGSREKELKEMAHNLGLSEKVIFTGHLHDVTSILNIVDIVVVSSLSEALSLSIIEGMSLGKPIIATDVGGNPELVRDGYNGILVPAKDSQSLNKAIVKLIDNPGIRRIMGSISKVFVDEYFTVDIMTRNLEKVYYRLLNKKLEGIV